MDERGTIRLSLWLAAIVFVKFLLAEITQHSIFNMLGVIVSVWLFLNLYWLSVWYVVDKKESE